MNHIAISTRDMKGQLEFWCDVLGMPLKGLFWMHNTEGVYHAFIEMAPNSYISVVHDPNNSDAVQYGVTHSGNAVGFAAAGVVQHIAVDVDSLDEVVALRDRIRSRGIQVLGPIDHGWWKSIYFAGPDHTSLEITTGGDIQPNEWVDPEVVKECGISPEELEQLLDPTPFDASQGPVPQPAADPSKPTMHWPGNEDAIVMQMEMSDDDVWAKFSATDPPVPGGK
ncbi:VOC family protein [Streptomyces canus]|uniref:VOC family protein n=1 Tax=Streptomyces canus TaxID=58343 RepID=UPI0033BA6E93